MNEETNNVAEQPKEKNILIVGTTEPGVVTYLKGYATKRGLKSVVMTEEEIQIFMNHKDTKYKDTIQHKTLKAFVESKENREEALGQAIKLYSILSGKKTTEGADTFVFKKTDAVHNTTLSHKQFDNFVNMLEVFNMIKRVGKQEYQFTFSVNDQRLTIQNGIRSLIRAAVTDITRYNANIDADDSMSDAEKAEAKQNLLDFIQGELK